MTMSKSETVSLLGILVVVSAIAGITTGASLKIIGGSDAEPGEFPWIVSLQSVDPPLASTGAQNNVCVGAIVDTTHVVTAAHCVYQFPKEYLKVVAGAHNISRNETTQQQADVLEIFLHPNYHEYVGTSRNDLALLRVTPLVLTTYVQPIRLPPPHHEPSGDCWITGWGQTSSGEYSHVLQKGLVDVVNQTKCYEAYQDMFDSKIQVCAGKDNGEVDACLFDTGGPLQCLDMGYTYIAGVVSWGYLCAVQDFPGVYTRIPFYVDWVRNYTGNAS